ncbi:MAG: glycosyltransferase family 4 protein [Bacteroidota bacterium]
MPEVLILCAHRPNRSPSQRYRFEQYLPFLEEKGYTFTFSYLLDKNDDRLFYSVGNFSGKVLILIKSVWTRIRDLSRFKKFDLIFIQREASFFGTSFFEKRAFQSGKKVIFDFDDSIWLADTSPGNQKWEWIKKPAKFFDNLKYANSVIAGNAYLAEKARPFNKNVFIIPTTINTALHFPKPELRNKTVLTIGWSGSISTVKHFELLLPVLLKIREKYGDKIKFKLIGDPHYKNDLLNVESVSWTEDTEVDQLNSFDIGLMPLPDDEWANGKCGLKGLSYMACCVPTIMSAVGVNKEIIQNGVNGFLANTDEEWSETICRLIENKKLREELGERGRETVIEKYSVDANKNNYLDAFNFRS